MNGIKQAVAAASIILLCGCDDASTPGDEVKKSKRGATGEKALTEVVPTKLDTSTFRMFKAEEPGSAPLAPPGRSFRAEYPDGGLVLGQGWSTLTREGTAATCVEVEEHPLESTSFKLTVDEVRDRYSLMKAESGSVSAAGSYGAVSGSASASFSRSESIVTDSLNFLFTFASTNGGTHAVAPRIDHVADWAVRQLSGEWLSKLSPTAQEAYVRATLSPPRNFPESQIKLSKAASELLTAGDITEFRRMCGDGFVSAIHRGARARFLASFGSVNRSTSKSIAASISAKGYGMSGTGSYAASITEEKKNQNARVAIVQEGGAPLDRPDVADITSLLTHLDTVGKDSSKLLVNPTAFEVSVVPYETLPGFPKIDEGDPVGLDRVASYYLLLTSIASALDKAVDVAVKYPASDGDYDLELLNVYGGKQALSELKNRLELDLAVMERFVRVCFDRTEQGACSERAAAEKVVNATLLSLDALKDDAESQRIEVSSTATDPAAVPYRLFEGQLQRKKLSSARLLEDDAFYKFKPDPGFEPKDVEPNPAEPTKPVDPDASLASAHKMYQDEITKYFTALVQDGRLVDEFFLRYYLYLSALPLPKSIFPLVNLRQETIEKTLIDAKIPEDEARLLQGNHVLKKTIFLERLVPARRRLCEGGRELAMCIPEAELWAFLTTQVHFSIPSTLLAKTPEPATPQPAPAPKPEDRPIDPWDRRGCMPKWC